VKSGKVVIVSVIVAGVLIAFALAAGIVYVSRHPRPRKLIWRAEPMPQYAVSKSRAAG